MQNALVALPEAEISAVCQKRHVREMALFGSILRSDFGFDSDVDVLVEFDNGYDLDALLGLKDDLETAFNRPVDFVVKSVVEADTNPYRREELLGTAQVIYRAG